MVKEASESVSTPGRPKSVRKTALNQLITQVDGSRVNGSSVGEADESFFDDDYTDDFEDTFDEEPITFNMDRDDLSLPSSEHSRNYPVTCSVIYPYKVQMLVVAFLRNIAFLSHLLIVRTRGPYYDHCT